MKEYLRDKYLKEIKEVLNEAKGNITKLSYEILLDNLEDYIITLQEPLVYGNCKPNF